MPSMDTPEGQQQQQQQHHYDRSSSSNDDLFLDQMLSSISSWPEIPQPNAKFPWDTKDRSPSNADEDDNAYNTQQYDQIGVKPLMLQLNQQQQEGDGVSFESLGQHAVGNHHRFPIPQNYGGSTSATSGAVISGGAAPPKQKVRARRGQATDPHSIAERLRRERIAERMKALQELVPNANKTDKASMLDEIIDYVKFLQLQVKVLSMSRLGGAAAVAPLMANMSSERVVGGLPTGVGNGKDNILRGSTAIPDGAAMTEHQVAKMMEEDMGSAMQYLQGKGLCLMPISLASAISTATGAPSRPASAAAPPRYSANPLAHGQQSHSSGSGEGLSSSVTAEGASPVNKEGPSASKSDT